MDNNNNEQNNNNVNNLVQELNFNDVDNYLNVVTPILSQHPNLGNNPTREQITDIFQSIFKQMYMSEGGGNSDADATEFIQKYDYIYEPLATISMNINNALKNPSETSINIISENFDQMIELVTTHNPYLTEETMQRMIIFFDGIKTAMLDAYRSSINNRINYSDSIYLPD